MIEEIQAYISFFRHGILMFSSTLVCKQICYLYGVKTLLAICMDYIGDKLRTYKLLRYYSSLPFSLIRTRINNHDIVMEVDILDLDELKRVRTLIHNLTVIETIVSMKDSTGMISFEILNNIITTSEEIAAEREELDALMFDEEE